MLFKGKIAGKLVCLLIFFAFIRGNSGVVAAAVNMQPGIVSPAQNTRVSRGSLVEIKRFASSYLEARQVQVWLPEGYREQAGRHYAVLYMHDGQMLFDGDTTWNRQEWGLDETAALLQERADVKDFIVVGIFNGGDNRHSEYFPQKPFMALPEQTRAELYKATRQSGQLLFNRPVNSDAYLAFIVNELKPYIDKHFAVKTDRENTVIMGSSMGGLISLYALVEYPEVFGAAGCLSTHWPGIMPAKDNPVPERFYAYLNKYLPESKSHKIYFDFGTETLDAFYPPLQQQVDKIMQSKGYGSKDWLTKAFPGAGHNEMAWRSRLHIPLRFLLARPVNTGQALSADGF